MFRTVYHTVKMKEYFILGKKWWDAVNGNTYHKVEITELKTGAKIVNTIWQYGYGDHWMQTAYEELVKLGLVEKQDRFNHELNRGRFIKEVVDVPTRETDL